MLNGVGWWPNDCVCTLEMLTQSSGLRCLTMLTWANVIAQRMMVRSTQAWCSACYAEWRENGQIIYNPLIWSLQAVAACPRHHHYLQVSCPYENCQHALPFITIGSKLGYCTFCNRWLGVESVGTGCGVAIAEKERIDWDTNAIGELMVNAPSVVIPPNRENISLAIKRWSERITQGNTSFLGHKLGINAVTMLGWQSGSELPQLGQLLQVCFHLGLSLFHFLMVDDVSSQDITTTRVQEDTPNIQRGRHKRVGFDELKQQLENVLLEDPPPSLTEVALRLGYRTSDHLSQRFPDLRRAITERYKQWFTSSLEARRQMRKPLKTDQLKENLEAVLTKEEIPPPTVLQVAQRLGYRTDTSLYRRFPDLCRAITAKRAEYYKQFNLNLQRYLKAIIRNTSDPIPSLFEIAEQFGCSSKNLSNRFPELCRAISVRYREQLNDQRKQILEGIINNDSFPPPSLEKVAKQLDCGSDTLRRNFPDFCIVIMERYQRYIVVRKLERDQRVFSEIRRAVFDLHAQGVYPNGKKVQEITRPAYLREPLAANAWHEAVRELQL